MNNTMFYTGQLVVMQCWCGIYHAVPEPLQSEQERQHQNKERQTGIYCPLGHSHIISGKSKVDLLQEKLDTAQKSTEFWRKQTTEVERKLTAQKGEATKLRKRIAAGVCPCCKRSFVQLSRHMERQHPDYAESES